jgi:arginyl-tRNA synthetase
MMNWNPKKVIYFVDVRQALHLKQVFEIAKKIGWLDIKNKEKTELFQAYN